MNIKEYLQGNPYPGRFIAAGCNAKGELVYGYAIMGRSKNSRNRIFKVVDGSVSTEPYDSSLVQDPSLIIYPAILKTGNKIIVTNGDQTLDIKKALEEGKTIQDGLVARTFEPDAPNYTPRISLVISEDSFQFAINRRKENGECELKVWIYPRVKGVLHVIHTYEGDGNPLPSFAGDPVELEAEDDFARKLWDSLNHDNRISLYVKEGRHERVFNARIDEEGRRIDLKYGCNPNQKVAWLESKGTMPLTVLNGRPGYINLMDALNGIQLVTELKQATGLAAAASFKHVSPAGAAVAVPLSETERKMYFISSKKVLSPLATAYIRARGADRMASFGDFVSLSDVCDASTASIISKEVSDGVIAPGYEPEALEILKKKKKGGYLVLQMDPSYVPQLQERRTIFGLDLVQDHNDWIPDATSFANIQSRRKDIPEEARLDLIVALLALKYTQSNSVCYAEHGQTIGVGAGQQSRIACTRLAGSKADLWHLRHADKVLALPFLPEKTRNDKDNIIEQYLADDPEIDVLGSWQEYFTEKPEPFTREEKKAYLASLRGTSLGSDGFFPFRDNIDRAAKSSVSYVAEPGGSTRDEDIIQAADEHDMVLCFTGIRLFHH